MSHEDREMTEKETKEVLEFFEKCAEEQTEAVGNNQK